MLCSYWCTHCDCCPSGGHEGSALAFKREELSSFCDGAGSELAERESCADAPSGP